MLLRPKKIKYIKYHRRKKNNFVKKIVPYKATTILSLGESGLIALESGFFTARQIEVFRRVVRRCLQKKGNLISAVFPDLPITKKPLATRIGKGKGNISYWTAKVAPGTLLFEVASANNEIATYALKKASKKLSIKTKVIYRLNEIILTKTRV